MNLSSLHLTRQRGLCWELYKPWKPPSLSKIHDNRLISLKCLHNRVQGFRMQANSANKDLRYLRITSNSSLFQEITRSLQIPLPRRAGDFVQDFLSLDGLPTMANKSCLPVLLPRQGGTYHVLPTAVVVPPPRVGHSHLANWQLGRWKLSRYSSPYSFVPESQSVSCWQSAMNIILPHITR
jgi:hypothetical protein